MNHREIEYNAKKLSGCNIPDSFACDSALLEWLDETGKRVFDEDLVMDYGTDCLRLYLLFEKTPRENDAPYYDSWQEGALEGIYKFLGRYRRMILAADEWNRRGNYKEEMLSPAGIDRMNRALEDTTAKIRKCISRGNTMPNRHNIVSAMMELLNVYQKELKIGAIIASFHEHAVKTAVPHKDIESYAKIEQSQIDQRNRDVTELCQSFVILMAPYVPDLSKMLFNYCHNTKNSGQPIKDSEPKKGVSL
ncbi:MAG: hypothetical protein K2K74_02705 [Lachnospiraceae bacterium]|nr:hypothetical protein [Lachnospiraceae bacterium]